MATEIDLTRNISSQNKENVPVHGFTMPTFLEQQQQVIVNPNSGMNICPSISSNPFLPPPLKAKILKVVEKLEYIDLDDMLPTQASLSS